jgi:hypothetical protein
MARGWPGPRGIRELLRPAGDGRAKFPHLPRRVPTGPGRPAAACAGRDARAGQGGLLGDGVSDAAAGRGRRGAFAQAGALLASVDQIVINA